MKKEDKESQKRYLEKVARARTTLNLINPDETTLEKMERIRRAKEDVRYMVMTYLPHYATAECAEFQIRHAGKVKEDPLYKGYAEWGRGLAKSVWNDVIIPLWLWMNKETYYYCLVSDTFDRACDLLEDLRAEFEGNELLKHDFGEQENPGYWEKGNFVTVSGFICKAFGVKMKVRGLRKGARRPDLWGFDDVETPATIKNSRMQDEYAEWVENDVLPTMTGNRRRFIGSNNRFASRMVQTILRERHPDWDWDLVKAYNPVTYEPAWPAMYSPEFYRQQEKDMGILAAHAEYNHEPLVKGKIFKPEMVLWGKLPDLHSMNAIVGHWDIAYAGTDTSDFNACKVWGRHQKDFWLMKKLLIFLRHLRDQGCKILLAQTHHQKVSGNGIVHLPVFIPQGTVQGQTHELTIVIADDSHRVCKGVNSSNRAAHRLLQGFQVVVNLDLLRMLSRRNFQHRQGVFSHANPPFRSVRSHRSVPPASEPPRRIRKSHRLQKMRIR